MVFEMFRFQTLLHEVGVFMFLRFEERFWKPPFSWRISVDGKPNWKKSCSIFPA